MSTDKDKLALTGDVVRAAIARMEEDMKSNPNAWYPMLTSMIVGLADKLDVVTKVAIGSAREVAKYKKIFDALAQQMAAQQPATEESGEQATAPVATPGDHAVGADGSANTPEQAAIEAQMDAAIGNMPVEQPATAARRPRGNGRKAPTAPEKKYVTAAGEVTDPAQIAAEKLMDEAMGVE